MEQTKSRGIINSFALHIIAMVIMLGDHMWATLFPYLNWLTCLGRIAYPIFAFMIAEGFFRTRNFKKYMLRMLVFALISEIPFDLIYGSTAFYPYHQNVLWTFMIALGLMRFLEWVKSKGGIVRYILASVAACIVGFVVGTLTMVDYYGAGVLVVLLFYFTRKRNFLSFIIQFAFLYYVFVELIGGYYYPVTIFGHYFELVQEAFSLLALIPIWLYNGKHGYSAKWFKYFCYGFYPGHLLILYIVWQILLKLA